MHLFKPVERVYIFLNICRKRERNDDLLSTHSHTHWLSPRCALSGDRTCNLGTSGRRFDPPSTQPGLRPSLSRREACRRRQGRPPQGHVYVKPPNAGAAAPHGKGISGRQRGSPHRRGRPLRSWRGGRRRGQRPGPACGRAAGSRATRGPPRPSWGSGCRLPGGAGGRAVPWAHGGVPLGRPPRAPQALTLVTTL